MADVQAGINEISLARPPWAAAAFGGRSAAAFGGLAP